MRCSCTACLLSSVLELLHMGKAGMAMRLVKQALRAERERVQRENTKPAKAPTRARKARRRRP